MNKIVEPQTPSSDKLAPSQTTMYLMAQAFHALRALWIEPALKEKNITSLQFTLLAVVARHSGLSSADLSRRFYVTPQTMGQVLTVLESRGLLIRAENPENRRLLSMSLTAQGHALVDACQADMQAIEEQVFGSLNDKEMEKFRGTLQKVVAKVRDK